MGTRFDSISPTQQKFIEEQKIFFVGTATADSHINVSPKGMDFFRVMGPNRVVWLNLTGSSNESSAHIQHLPRMTIMFCAFNGAPMILRLFGTAKVIHRNDAQWNELAGLFPEAMSARQVFDMQVDIVQTSCGFGVPLMNYEEDRSKLMDWAAKRGPEGIQDYWRDNNQITIDGIETNILELNMPKD